MLQNLTGWHILVILFTFAVFLVIVAVVITIAVRAAGRSQPTPVARYGPPQPTATTPAEDASSRLKQIKQLRETQQISDAEYQAKRAEIVSGI